MTDWGYARVSTVDQDVSLQLHAMHAAGIKDQHIVIECASGSREDRPALLELLNRLAEGDRLTVWKLDRLGRSLSHLISVINDLGERGVEFRSLTEALDTSTAGGRLLFHIMGAVAEFSRDLTIERTRAALQAAKAQNRQIGRPSTVNEHQYRLIQEMAAAGRTHAVIAASTGLSRAVVGRVIRGEIASLDRFATTVEPGSDELPLYRKEPA